MQKIAFIDRDGTLIYEPTEADTPQGEIPYQIDSLEKLRILPGVTSGLKRLIGLRYKLVMVTNQDDLSSTRFTYAQFELPQLTLLEIFRQNAIQFDECLICPHAESAKCSCRKPKTGLIDGLKFDPQKSIVIGDRESDREFAKNLGVRFVKAETNKGINEELLNNL